MNNIPQNNLVREVNCVNCVNGLESNFRYGENLLKPPLPPVESWQDGDRLVAAITHNTVFAEEVMGRNFSGRTAFEKERGLPVLSEKNYRARGLTGIVPWFLETLNSSCPFIKGRLVRHSHFLILMEMAPWEGKIPDDEDAVWKLEWILRLKGSPLDVDEAKSLELPPEYKKLLVVDKEKNVRVLITRKPDEIK